MSDQPWYEIVGFSLFGPPPLGDIHVPWRNGIHVLYGRNGVGKSRVLDALLAFQRNRELLDSQAFLHIRYRPGSTFSVDSHRSIEKLGFQIGEGAGEELPQLAAMNDLFGTPKAEGLDVYFSNEFLEGTLGELVERALDPLAWLVSEGGLGAIEQEIFNSRTLSFGPEKGVWASAIVGSHTPKLQEILAAVREEGRGWKKTSVARLFGHYVRHEWTLNRDWPAWVPIPVKRLAFGVHDLDLVRITSASGDDPEDGSNETAKTFLKSAVEDAGEDEGEALEILKFLLATWSTSASKHMHDLMIDGPDLMIELLPLTDWFDGRIVGWNAWDKFIGDWLPLFAMSEAQRKWADVAIYLGLIEATERLQPGSTTSLIIDEPEQALHPAAIEYLLQKLEAESHKLGGPVIVASHSPQVLALEGAQLLHVVRDATGHTVVRELSESLSTDLEETAEWLGMRKPDLLQLYRVFLIVEGLHDSTVLNAVFPNRWEPNRIRIVHMRGTRHVLDLVASEILRDFTDAKLVVLLDHVDEGFVHNIRAALSKAMDDHVGEAESILRSTERMAGHAERLAVQLARGFLQRPDALYVQGLKRGDIIEYLKPSAFGLRDDWSVLRDQHRADKARISDFKEWLRTTKGARINEQTIRDAAGDLSDKPPGEFEELLDLCLGLSGGGAPTSSVVAEVGEEEWTTHGESFRTQRST